ncbi:MAG TPA: hypothetical protein PKM43_19740 [Verrucomicrobiota bacterium]|nr:hypothetical protein [Verrucomicrobiota bacterium]
MKVPMLALWLLSGACLGLAADRTPGRAASPNLRLENAHLIVEVSPTNGAILRICDRMGGLELLEEPGLADNFKFTLPIRHDHAWQSTEANAILGRDQRLTSHRQTDTGLVLVWDAPLRSVLGKRYAVSAAMTLKLDGADLRFGLEIRNASKLEVGEVFYPILGGALGLGGTAEARRQTQFVVPETLGVRSAGIFHTFANMSWLGVFGPEQFYSYPDKLSMPWLALHETERNRSVYFGAHDPVPRYKVIHIEMSPGIAPGRADGNWPRREELDGAPAGVKFCFVHFPYQPAGQNFEAAPVVLRFHDGDWQTAARVYGEWLSTQPHLADLPGERSGRTPVFEPCDAVPFRDLAARAKAAAQAGAAGLLLRRWNVAGDSGVFPRFAPDPRLGTLEEFAEAVRQCHTLGVQVALVVSLPPVKHWTSEFTSDLHPLACRDRWGIPYTTVGASVPSPLTGGLGAGERRVRLNPAHPELRRSLVRDLVALAQMGVDAIHVQDFFGTPLDFNPALGRTPDRATWKGGLDCLRAIRAACRAVQPGFTVTTDAAWDHALDLSPTGPADVLDRCPLRAACPGWRPAFAEPGEATVESLDGPSDPGRIRRVIFDLASPSDLQGWKCAGGAFTVNAVPGLFTRPTLNSLAAAGETATGSALSPAFAIDARFDRAEVLIQGGWSEAVNGRENLVLQFLDADSGAVLLELVPPGVHELRTQRVAIDPLRGRTVRVRLVDENRNSSYAWIGLRRLVLTGPADDSGKE